MHGKSCGGFWQGWFSVRLVVLALKDFSSVHHWSHRVLMGALQNGRTVRGLRVRGVGNPDACTAALATLWGTGILKVSYSEQNVDGMKASVFVKRCSPVCLSQVGLCAAGSRDGPQPAPLSAPGWTTAAEVWATAASPCLLLTLHSGPWRKGKIKQVKEVKENTMHDLVPTYITALVSSCSSRRSSLQPCDQSFLTF